MVTEHYYLTYLQDKEIIFAYKGTTSSELFDCILNLTEEKLTAIEPHIGLKRKMYVIVVETLQNIYHHFEKKHSNIGSDTIIFFLAKNKKSYFLVSGNYITDEQQNILIERIDNVNMLDSNQLKAKYRESLNEEGFSSKGGAGLGLIDIARKSGKEIEYKFNVSKAKNIFFTMKIEVPF